MGLALPQHFGQIKNTMIMVIGQAMTQLTAKGQVVLQQRGVAAFLIISGGENLCLAKDQCS